MKILAIGDVVGVRAIEHLKNNLWKLRDRIKIDFVTANGENATEIHGLSAADAQKILDAGMFASAWWIERTSAEEYRRLISYGVTEFTEDHHCSMGLNW